MVDINCQGEVSAPRGRARVRVRILVSCRDRVLGRLAKGPSPRLGQLSNSVAGLE